MFENNLIFSIQENIHEKYFHMHETCPLLHQCQQLHYVHVLLTELRLYEAGGKLQDEQIIHLTWSNLKIHVTVQRMKVTAFILSQKRASGP